MAGAQVAHTFELLEHILLDLAPTDEEREWWPDISPDAEGLFTILTSKRVCKAFRDTVEGSKLLQKELFLTPPTLWSSEPGIEFLLCLNVMLLRNQHLELDICSTYFSGVKSACNVDVHPQRKVCRKGKDGLGKESKNILGEGASWRKMYASSKSYIVEDVEGPKDEEHEEPGRWAYPRWVEVQDATVGEMYDVTFSVVPRLV